MCVDEDDEVKGHLGVKRSNDMSYENVKVFVKLSLISSFFWHQFCSNLEVGTNDHWVLSHIWYLQRLHQRSSRGQKVILHVLLIAKSGETRGSRTTLFYVVAAEQKNMFYYYNYRGYIFVFILFIYFIYVGNDHLLREKFSFQITSCRKFYHQWIYMYLFFICLHILVCFY